MIESINREEWIKKITEELINPGVNMEAMISSEKLFEVLILISWVLVLEYNVCDSSTVCVCRSASVSDSVAVVADVMKCFVE